MNGAQVTKATADLPDDQREAVRWLFGHGKDRGFSLLQLSQRVGYADNTTLYRVFRGEYGASLANVTAKILAYRRVDEARAQVGRAPFIHTEVSRVIWKRCGDALIFQRVAPIIGNWQIGKSWALERYAQDHNHGQTRYVRLPAGSAFGGLLGALARACRLNASNNKQVLREQIVASLDSKNLLIVDEVDEPLAGRSKANAVQCYNFLREVFDRSGCGMVLCGNEEFAEVLSPEGELGRWMGKLRRRAMPLLRLPDTAPDADLHAIGAHYGLPEPVVGSQAAQTARHAAAEGLGQFVVYCQMAKKMAITDRERAVTWDDVATVHLGYDRDSAAGDGLVGGSNGKEGR